MLNHAVGKGLFYWPAAKHRKEAINDRSGLAWSNRFYMGILRGCAGQGIGGSGVFRPFGLCREQMVDQSPQWSGTCRAAGRLGQNCRSE
jgi:hypothetical protein